MTNERNPFEGPNWRDDPLEHGPPVRRGDSFLESRGYSNPQLVRMKMELVDSIRWAVTRKGWKQADMVAHVREFGEGGSFEQSDASRILNGNVSRYSIERLLLVLAALDNRVSVRSEPVEAGHGCLVMEHREREYA